MMRLSIGNEWEESAVCKSVDPDLWFPDAGEFKQEPITICMDCPVRRECLTLAFEERHEHGIWGGTIASERAPLLANYIRRGKHDRERVIENLLMQTRKKTEKNLAARLATKNRRLAKQKELEIKNAG